MSKVIYVLNLSSKVFTVSLISTDALVLLLWLNFFIFNSPVVCYFIMVSSVVGVFRTSFFWNDILLTGIFSFGILMLGSFCDVTIFLATL